MFNVLLSEFEKYKSLYEFGAKKISFRTSYLKIEKPSLNLKFEKSHGNYDLFFTKKGVLLKSIHNETKLNFEVIYAYDYNGILLKTFRLGKTANELLEINEFIYGQDKKMKVEQNTIISEKGNIVTEYLHTYNEGYEEIYVSSNFEDDIDRQRLFLSFDENKRIIEDKAVRNENELVWWDKKEYNDNGDIRKVISLDKDGHQFGIYEFFPCKNGLTTGYIYKSKEICFEHSYIYEFNEKGHWINQVMINDGEPTYSYDRSIEYF